MYRFTLYRIPTMRGGVSVLSSFGDRYTDLEIYQLGETVSDLTFDEGQTEVYFADLNAVYDPPSGSGATDIMSANYMRVAFTPSAVQPATNDSDPAWFWVTGIELIGTRTSAAKRPARVRISSDPWGDMFDTVYNGGAGSPFFKGLLRQTTKYTLLPGAKLSPPVKPAGNYSATITPLDMGTDDLYVILTAMSDSGGMWGLISETAAAIDEATFTAALQAFTTATKVGDTNISPLHVYVLPKSWIPSRWLSGSTKTVTSQSGLSVSAKLLDADTYNATYTVSSGLTVAAWDKVYFRTPGRTIEIDTKVSSLSPTSFSLPNPYVYIQYSGGAGGFGASEELTILLRVGDSFYDVSRDYETTVAVNDTAVKMSQQRLATVVGVASDVIGAAGGAVGGFASGNYFGGIQSLVGGVDALVNVATERKNPAQLKTAGGVMNAYYAGAGALARILCHSVTNEAQIESAVDYMGMIAESPSCATVGTSSTDFQGGNFYKFDMVEWIDCPIGEDAAQQICADFVRGVKFFTSEEI